MSKLDHRQKQMLRLIDKGTDESGWAPISPIVTTAAKKLLPGELVTIEPVGDKGWHRGLITEEGRKVLDAMAWI